MNDAKKQQIIGGQNFIQIGTWRFGMHDNDHFVFSNQSGFTSVIYRGYDGTIHSGPRKDFTLWNLPNAETKIKVGKNYIQFGKVWRLTQTDNCHLSLSHLALKTCMIWRVDGTKHPGPRTDFNGFSDYSNNAKIGVGQDFIEIGNWRIGATDNFHLSIGTRTLVSEIYRSDGTIHDGPRMDFRMQKNDVSPLN